MSSRLTLTFILIAAVPLSACGGGAGAIEPGDRVGEMIVTTGTSQSPGIFEFCNPIVLKPGVYSRACTVPAVPQLFIGYGTIEKTKSELDQVWHAQAWEAYLDGREIDLGSFSTMPDRTFFETSVGSAVWLREWNVLLVEPTPGEHTLRYVTTGAEPADTTWTFTVTRG